ncbi:MAG: aldo/keto reductase [Candidatus Nitronauta litoralis]|uniref:Aldo/keto reductase n=1 Tax=Candidatus Nitronauta litoralis TaxID=2705533 RepID=A0A7T0BTG0_9BACT|nr:MAG: aldo/keto reductase [Candidatus Nitronauta litoralis]
MRSLSVEGLGKPWTRITFGCWQIAPSGGWGDLCTAEEADRVVKAAYDGGIRAFDTAEGYGDGESERRLAKALGTNKDEVLIISKMWPDAPFTLPAYTERLDNTLKALDRDYVDVYLMHWPSDDFSNPANAQKMVELMVALRDSGKTRAIGLSNFRAEDLKRLGNGLSEFTVNQVPYNLLQREYEGETIEICQKAGVGYMAYSPTARGLFGGRVDAEARRPPTRQQYFLYQEPYFSRTKPAIDLLAEIALELNTSPINVAVAWVIAQSNLTTAVVGSRKWQQIEEVCPAGDLTLSVEQLERLNAVSDQFQKETG